ncbi:amino acid adenylation domain-containing protein, partial [Xanthomonas sp. 1678]|uniref:amino acid adenylation domain-containing protein n=1 Tax=Xanthomonas sp. 1678 TaxID=3158788 RepID=UPI00285F841B|nr:amino acid adenylation domain-containing protein [Xanthomonas translucens]
AAIAQVWQELLGLERVGRHDHFFELGGHSLLVVVMIERLRDVGIEVDVRSLFEAPTVAQLALRIDVSAVTPFAVPVPANPIAADCVRITPDLLPLVDLAQPQIDALVAAVPGGAANVQDIYPLSPLQEGLLFHHLLQREGDAYVMRSVLAFDTRERLDAFLGALQQVIDRHDILRSAVHWEGLPEPVQVVQRQATLPVQDIVPTSRGTALEQLLEQTDPRRLRMNIRHAPLLQAHAIADAAAGEWLLALLDHHLISDNYSLQLILGEVRTLLQGNPRALPPPLPYCNFIAHGRAVPQAEHERYFHAQLHDVTAPTAPFDVLDVQGGGADVAEAREDLDAALARAVRAQARQWSVTPAVLFHVAWAQVLARCAGNEDVVFGTVLSGRLQGSAGADQAIGVFINTLPLRLPLAGSTVEAAVRETYRRLGELLTHEQAPLSLAQRCSGVDRALPLFTALLNYRHSHAHLPAMDGPGLWDGMRVLREEERTNYPIALSVDDLGQGFVVSAQCAAGLDAARLVGYVRTALAALVQALAHAPQRPLRELPILPAQEQAQLARFNATQAEYPADALVHELFEAQAARQPDALALVFEGRTLSYRDLNAQSNRLAHRLRELGAGPERCVALCAQRGLGAVVGMLAILKAGGAYVPLDPAYPAARLAWLLEDSAPVVLLTAGEVPDTVSGWRGGAILDLAQVDLSAHADTDPDHAGEDPAQLAYVIYTSGSTGQPKGVAGTHRALVNRLCWGLAAYPCGANGPHLQRTSCSFVDSITETLTPLLAGTVLEVAPGSALRSADGLLALIAQRGIERLTTVPSLLKALLDVDGGRLPSSLRDIVCSGEALPSQLARRVLAGNPQVQLINFYGSSEVIGDVTAYRCTGEEVEPGVPIGRPIANTQVHILDGAGRPVPIGVRGELHVGGVAVARGYLNLPGLTAERFVPDPFASSPDARLYRTGDLGRWRDDGTIEYLGRNDHQVKIRGFRIELGEIEAQLRRCDGVREAVVLAQGEDERKRLLAYVVSDQDGTSEPAALRARLQGVLPEYMVPSIYMRLDALPLTASGKLDRSALPAPNAGAVATRTYVAPQSPTEMVIAQIWQELLGLERVGRHDHFFDLGGHSLLAVQLLVRLRERFDIDVSLKSLFEQATLIQMADLLDVLQLQSLPRADVDDMRKEIDGLSEQQLRELLMQEPSDE